MSEGGVGFSEACGFDVCDGEFAFEGGFGGGGLRELGAGVGELGFQFGF